MNTNVPEPMLTFKLTDLNEFHCSAGGQEIASFHNTRFIVVGIADLIERFRRHVEVCHGSPASK